MNPLYVAPVIHVHASTGLPMSITNLANLEILNDQPIKTGKEISFENCPYSSVDAIVAFLVKFNPAVESLDFSKMQNLQSKWRWLHVPPVLQYLTSSSCISALPKEIGELSALQKLDLGRCKSLKGE